MSETASKHVPAGERPGPKAQAHCRFCNAVLQDVFLDLGLSPLANSYVPAERMATGEMFFR